MIEIDTDTAMTSKYHDIDSMVCVCLEPQDRNRDSGNHLLKTVKLGDLGY